MRRASGAAADQIEIREEIDGAHILLGSARGNAVRQQAGMLLIGLGIVEAMTTSTIVLALLLHARPGVPLWVIFLVVGALVSGGAGMAIAGAWLSRSRVEIIVGRDEIRGVRRLGPIRWTRRRRVGELERIVLTREILKGVNIPGAKDGHPDYLTLWFEGARRRTALAGGHHRGVLEAAGEAIAGRLRVPLDEE